MSATVYQIRDYQRPTDREAIKSRMEKNLESEAMQIFNAAFPQPIPTDYDPRFYPGANPDSA